LFVHALFTLPGESGAFDKRPKHQQEVLAELIGAPSALFRDYLVLVGCAPLTFENWTKMQQQFCMC